jgi:hypothetical protein
MEINTSFEAGRMNTDVDPTKLGKGEYIEANNVSPFTGALIPMKKPTQRTFENLSNPVILGDLQNPVLSKSYYFYKEDNSDGLIEYDINTHDVRYVLKSTTGLLNFQNAINSVNLIGDYLFWTNKDNAPRRVDLTKTYATDGFTEKDIQVIQPAPVNSPILTMYDTNSAGSSTIDSNGENNIEERFLSFCTAYKSKTGEMSAFSPFSRIAFTPEKFSYDYSTHINNGMVNAYNSVDVRFNVGNYLIEEVHLYFKVSGSNSVYRVDKFNKEDLGDVDDDDRTYTFNNMKRDKVMRTSLLSRTHDMVPLLAGAQGVAGSRLFYVDYEEGRDLVDSNGSKVVLEHSVDYISNVIDASVPKESLKSNRDIEIGLLYIDAQTRITPSLVSKTNTTFIKHSDAVNENRLKITIPHNPPEFATHYRLCVKQSTMDYDVIIPSRFYEDGVFRWVQFQDSDKDKINSGDFLVVKRDSQGLIEENIEVRILEVAYKEANFLRPEFTGNADEDEELRKIKQDAGYYFKIKPRRFSMSYADLEILEDDSYHNTRNAYDNYVSGEAKTIEAPIFYGDGMEGIVSGGTYTPPSITGYDSRGNAEDIRIKLVINTGGSTFDMTTNSTEVSPPTLANETIPTDGSAVSLAYGVTVTFPSANAGYIVGNEIVISAKKSFDDSDSINRATLCFKGFTSQTGTGTNESVQGGASVSFYLKEYGGVDKVSSLYEEDKDFPASSKDYDNLEEWWHEEGNSFTNVDDSMVFFRRGYKTRRDSSYLFYDKGNDISYPMHMFLRGQLPGGSGSKRAKMTGTLKIEQFEDSSKFALFETRPKDNPEADLFYEIGDTYEIKHGKHLGNSFLSGALDQDQTDVLPAVIHSRFFNCYAFGNGVESYKIKDSALGSYMRLDSRVFPALEDYKREKRESDFTWSGAFNEDFKRNNLNEFNSAELNFKPLSTKDSGPIRKIITRDGDFVVFQERLVSKVMFGRTILSNVDGTVNVVATNDILGAQNFYSQVFGVGNFPESVAEYGNNFFFLDPYNGTIVRGGFSGLDEIVGGRKMFFKDEIKSASMETPNAVYDLLNDSYVVNINGVMQYYREAYKGWTTQNENYGSNTMFSMDNRVFIYIQGDVHEMYTGEQGPASVKTAANMSPDVTKVFEALRLESNQPLDITVTANQGSAKVVLYEKREDFYHGEIPKSADGGGNKYGLGLVKEVNGLVVTMSSKVNYQASVGDLFTIGDVAVGKIESISGFDLTLDSASITVLSGVFAKVEKSEGIEGSSVRGTVAILDIEFDEGKDHKLLAVNTNIDKSYN